MIKPIIIRGLFLSFLTAQCMLLADSYYTHKRTLEIAKDFESNPMSSIVQYFPRDHYLLTDYLWLDMSIAFLASLFIFLSVCVILRHAKHYARITGA